MTVLSEKSGRQNSAYRSGCHIGFVFNKLLTRLRLSVHNSVHFSEERDTVARVNIVRSVKTPKGWANVALKRNTRDGFNGLPADPTLLNGEQTAAACARPPETRPPTRLKRRSGSA